MTARHDDQGWKLEELAQHAGVSPRTVRYYVQRGLLPAPHFRGRDTVYGHEHLLRLQAIRRLQERYLPLDAIQEQLSRMAAADLQGIVDDRDTSLRHTSITASVAAAPSLASEAPHVETDEQRWVRWILAPGVEVHLAEHVDAKTRQRVRELCDEYIRRYPPRRKR